MNLLYLLGGGLLLSALSKNKGGVSPVEAGPSYVPSTAWLVGVQPLPWRPERVTEDQARRAAALLEGLERAGIPAAARLALLAFAWHETRLDPRAVGMSPTDAAAGGSYTVLQLRRNVELAAALAATGLTFTVVVPDARLSGDALLPYVRRQAALAAWLAREKGVFGIYNRRGSDYDRALVDLAMRWAGIQVDRTEDLQSNPIAGPVLRQLGGRLPTNAEIPSINEQLRARGSQMMGTFERLATYRVFRDALLRHERPRALSGVAYVIPRRLALRA